jgi:hypothetical protein
MDGWNGVRSICGIRNPDLRLCVVAEAQSMGLMLKLQEQTEDQGLDGRPRTPRLPKVQGHRATTSVRPQVHLRGTEEAVKPLLLS